VNRLGLRLQRSPIVRLAFGLAGTWIATDFTLFQFGWTLAWLPLATGVTATLRATGVALKARRHARLAEQRRYALQAEERRLRPLDRPTGVDVVRLHSTPQAAEPHAVRPALGRARSKPVRYDREPMRLGAPPSAPLDPEKELHHESTRTSS
jgi:hypothetical protein